MAVLQTGVDLTDANKRVDAVRHGDKKRCQEDTSTRHKMAAVSMDVDERVIKCKSEKVLTL